MDALDFWKEYKRMCNSYKYCNNCPLVGANCLSLGVLNKSDRNFLIITNGVETWSKEHPLVTNEMKFREVFGDNAANSILALHPSDIKRWLAEPYKERV